MGLPDEIFMLLNAKNQVPAAHQDTKRRMNAQRFDMDGRFGAGRAFKVCLGQTHYQSKFFQKDRTKSAITHGKVCGPGNSPLFNQRE